MAGESVKVVLSSASEADLLTLYQDEVIIAEEVGPVTRLPALPGTFVDVTMPPGSPYGTRIVLRGESLVDVGGNPVSTSTSNVEIQADSRPEVTHLSADSAFGVDTGSGNLSDGSIDVSFDFADPVRCLREFAPTAAGAGAVVGLLEHPVPQVREEAARALIQAPHEAALPGLVQALESESFRLGLLALMALSAISRIDDAEVRVALASIARSHTDEETREAAGRLLVDPDRNLMREYRTRVEEERRGQHRILHAD